MQSQQSYHMLNFGDAGLNYILGDKHSDEINKEFVTTIGTYYSIIIQQARESEKSFFGPFPVAQLPRYLVYIFKFFTKDSTVTNQRVLHEGRTIALVMWFIPIDEADIITENYFEIESAFLNWSKALKNRDISQVESKILEPLKNSIKTIIKVNKGVCIERKYRNNRMRSQIKHQFALLHDMYEQQLSKEISLVFLLDKKDMLEMLRVALLAQTTSYLKSYKADNNEYLFKYEGIQTTIVFHEVIDEQIATYVNKHADGILYITVECKNVDKTIKNTLKRTTKDTILSFVFLPECEERKKEFDLVKTGIYDLITTKKRQIDIIALSSRPDLLSNKLLEFLAKVIKKQMETT